MAKTGTGLSKRKHGNLQLLANMMVFQVAPLVADKSGIKNTAGLKGKRIPLGRFAEPDEIAHAGIYLISEKASFMTGEIMQVNGGSNFA